MKPIWVRIVAVGVFVWGTLLGSTPIGAQAAPFVGTWRTQNVLVLEDEVVLVLHLRISNQSGADVAGATVTVNDPVVPERQDHPSFTGVTILAGEGVALRGDMVVAPADYEHWLAGGHPSVQIEFTDGSGNQVSLPIELLPEPEVAS